MLEVIDKGSTTESHTVPLLLVHGACGTAWVWDENFLDFFADQGYRAVALSLRGHGASRLSKPLKCCSIADYVDDVHAVVDKLGSPPVLLGHSMGCWVVLNYLEMHSAPAAVLMAPGTPRGIRRLAFRVMRRHPWIALRVNTFGNPVDLLTLRLWPVNICSRRTPPTPASGPVRPVWSPRAHALYEKRRSVFRMLAL
jgi:pimeloyl-ACP methyl ester carboxylesterase